MSTKSRNTPNVAMNAVSSAAVKANASTSHQELLSIAFDTADAINVHNELERIADAFNAALGVEFNREQVAMMLTIAAGIIASNANHRGSVRTGAQAIASACVAFL